MYKSGVTKEEEEEEEEAVAKRVIASTAVA